MAKSKTTIDTGSYKYGTLKVRNKDGKLRYSAGNGDAVAKAMLVFIANGGKLTDVVKANGLDMKQGSRNDGLFRMSIGVALRGLIRNGQSVKIGSTTVKSLKQKVALAAPRMRAPAPTAIAAE